MLRTILGMRFMLVLVAIAAVSVVATACGGDDSEKPDDAKGNATEQAFLEGMVPHHRSAVAMARIAKNRAEHPEVRGLADDIVSAQNSEILQMEDMHQRLFGSDLKPNAEAHEELGVEAHEAGTEVELRDLRTAQPFDRTFIDMMIPHHQGAIRQARAALTKAADDELKRLANAIISAQSREIRQMNDWRRQWYGSESPSGGVPGTADAGEAEHEGATGASEPGHDSSTGE